LHAVTDPVGSGEKLQPRSPVAIDRDVHRYAIRELSERVKSKLGTGALEDLRIGRAPTM
jgi:hypothetical protein